jgi:hypothetical protein
MKGDSFGLSLVARSLKQRRQELCAVVLALFFRILQQLLMPVVLLFHLR